ncbi:MAG: sigma-70 family RNA polymerase sigma factor [Phycisphaerales bacterium]|nr:sigma-70 family RNA polymerase sigma factor [Phycisphaerales bacterium]
MPRKPQAESPIDKVWKRYLRHKKIEDRNALVVNYADLVHSHAARLSRRLPAQISYDEICSAAFDGLIEAVEAYDPKHKAKFETFCQQRISGAVMDWLRSLDPQSRTVRTFEKQRMIAKEMLDTEIGRPPTAVEIAHRMNMSVRRYEDLCRLSQLGKEVHFSAMEPEDSSQGHGTNRGWDVHDDSADDPSAFITREMLTEHISKGLAREERLILVLYYHEGLTMAEIGAVLNLSESRVSQIHKDILQRLRARFGSCLAEELAA